MKRLFLDFVNQTEGKRRRITIQSPKEDLTSQQVSDAMDMFISLGVVPGTYVKDRAAIVETTSNEFFNLL
ncbi:DUF2922 domain-containing protein [Pseudothermotoga lettingae]|uniref:DUF2922 domain-containing protein n=1 Tax=Pseudothermotoga lettingae (strain ATCC BAA-301 / DSM 14385 / NBRC 107922 / TMO) TaxID=416591 RepID=A8F6G2_PSELT|nr:DUF2922 domain-containing protein [Pseudothermotoga lettingae]ABV33746.1 conserved hypothetical protein [Pseudothermotoga lettingae TMO]GLI49335.1 hypothetical protein PLETTINGATMO_15040 [Pseudothermotoga lettingae TMO]